MVVNIQERVNPIASNRLNRQADEFLLKHGYHKNGKPVNLLSTKEECSESTNKAYTIASILANYGLFHEDLQDTEITECISGGFATRHVRIDELSFLIDADFKKNTWLVDLTHFEWKLFNLIVQRYLDSGLGIYHYQFVPKKGIFLALYKLLDNEVDKYKENYLQACAQLGITEENLLETRRLYGISEIERREIVPGKRYLIHTKKLTKAVRKRIETMFAKYQMEMKKRTGQDE